MKPTQLPTLGLRRYGLLWKRRFPTIHNFPRLRLSFAVCFCLAPLVLEANILYLSSTVETQAIQLDQSDITLRACLNGTATWTASDGSKVGCMPAQENPR